MKILLLTFNFGKSSSGKNTERIADGLYDLGHQIEIICGHNYTDHKRYKIHTINPNPLKPSRVLKILGNTVGRELNYIFWENRAKKAGIKIIKRFQPEVLYSRGSPIASMTVGHFFKIKFNISHLIHFADPIPPTLEWMKNQRERLKLLNLIKPIIAGANAISFVTEEMRNYQFKLIDYEVSSFKTFISPNPMPKSKTFGKPPADKFIFLYLGTFSEERNPTIVLEAFKEFTNDKEHIEFHIYGNSTNRKIFSKLNLDYKDVKLYSLTDDIEKVIKTAHVLIDVDSNFQEQVFISGKLMEYLSADRYILCITPLKSPARNFLSEIQNSVNFSILNIEEIRIEMENIYNKKWNQLDFEERKWIEQKAGISKVLETIELEFKKLED